MTTKPDRKRLRNMLEVASPAPWKQAFGYNNTGMPTAFFEIPQHNDNKTVEMLADDAALIVEMRNNGTELLDALDEAEKDVARLIAEREEALTAARAVGTWKQRAKILRAAVADVKLYLSSVMPLLGTGGEEMRAGLDVVLAAVPRIEE